MRNLTITTLCILLAAPLAVQAQSPGTGTTGAQNGAAGRNEAVRDQIIVALHPNESIEAVNGSFGTTTLRGIPSQNTFLLQVPPQSNASGMQSWLTNDPRVAWAELNFVAVAPGGGTQSFFLSATFNEYVTQPSLALVRADAAHRWAPMQGAGQVVAVLDTGVDPWHRMIYGRIAPGGFDYIGDSPDYRDIGNGIDDNGNGQIDEFVGHGTMVSGLILRIAPQARIIPMRVLNCDGVGASFYIAQAIDDAISHGATVINISLGSIRPSQTVDAALQRATSAGILIVAAAGNSNRDDPRVYPAAFENVLAVAGTDLSDLKAPFSDYGEWIDISAPAVGLSSAYPGNTYAQSSGNSMATPLVAGAAALLRSQQPTLTPQDVILRLRASSQNIDQVNPEYSGLLGSGRLNVNNAVMVPTGSRK